MIPWEEGKEGLDKKALLIKYIFWFYLFQVLLEIVEHSRIGIWLLMAHQNRHNLLIPQRNQ